MSGLSAIKMLASASALSFALAGTAFAQDAAADEAAAAEGQAIVVTGSRIQNPNFTSPTPVQTVTAEVIQQRAPAQISDVVNEIPAFRVTRSAAGSGRTADFQSGVQATLDLRGLDAIRTLTLVNGRRIVGTQASGAFDTNMIPVGLVERVEVVSGGASAAYGSDAVAGVANFVLRNKMTGLTGSVQAGVSSRGDGAQYVGTLAGGFSFADGRGHVILGGDVATTTGVGNIRSRDFGTTEAGLFTTTAAQRTANTTLASQVFADGVQFANVAPGGIITSSTSGGQLYAFDATGTPYLFTRGTVYGTGVSAVMTGSTSNTGANPNDFFLLQVPNDRYVAYGRAEYEVADGITLFAEGNYGRTSMPKSVTSSYTASFQVLRTSLPTALQSLYTGTNVTIGKLLTENGGGSQTFQDLTTYRTMAGIDAKLTDDITFNAYYSRGRTHQNFNVSGLILSGLYKSVYGCNGLASTVAGGNPNLTAALAAQVAQYESVTGKTCVAFNPLGVNNGQAAYNYFVSNQHQETELEQDVAAASISGTAFDLWAGPLSFAVGAEYRRDKLDVVSDPLLTYAFFTGFNSTSYGGSNYVKEGFIELGLPVLKDSAIGTIDLNGAVRRTDYKLSGAVTTWKVGGVWEPVDGLRLRATRSRDIRAPNLSELFFNGGALPGQLANAIPGTAGFGVTGPSITGGRGNANLVPEKADTLTVGAVFAPTGGALAGFRAAVDYYKIKVNGAIVRPNTAQSQNICAALIAGGATTCPGFTFTTDLVNYPNGIISQYNISQNINALKVEGIDFELGYRRQVGPGTFNIRALANYAIHNQQVNALVGRTFENAGSANGTPKWSGNVTVGYDVESFRFDVQVRGFTSVKYDTATLYNIVGGTSLLLGPEDAGYAAALAVAANANTINQNRFAGRVYTNLNFAWDVNKQFTFFGVVNNLFDVQPPKYAAIAITNGARNLSYDLLGRSYKVGVRFNF